VTELIESKLQERAEQGLSFGWSHEAIMKLRAETRHAVLSTIFLFGLLTWLYVVLVQMVNPDWMSAPLTHLDVFPLNLRVDLTGILAFIVSAVAFFLLQLAPSKERKR
jgi:heme/copper-type cytochrome/quinol oxidase subunit 3